MECDASTVDLRRESRSALTVPVLEGATIERRYHVLEYLGAGGMGVVVRCADLERGSQVAVKLLRYDRRDDRSLRYFLDEITALRATKSPGIVELLANGVDREHGPYYVMPILSGEPLSALVGQPGGMALSRAIAITVDVATRLQAIHGAGWIHGDIKPANVMVDATDAVTLIDFGLAHEPTRERSEIASGTPAYMAPEILLGEPSTFASDQYALGAMLYEMLLGEPPFVQRFGMLSFRHQLHSVPQAPSARRRDLPRELDRIVLRALAKPAEARWGSLAEMSLALRQVIAPRGALSR